MDLNKFLTLVGSVHFMDLNKFFDPGWVRLLCGSNLLVVMTQHSLNVPP